MPQLYSNPDHEALRLNAMKVLAIETGNGFSVVRQVYEVELARLQAGAHITEYVLVLSRRRAREALRAPATPVRSQLVAA